MKLLLFSILYSNLLTFAVFFFMGELSEFSGSDWPWLALLGTVIGVTLWVRAHEVEWGEKLGKYLNSILKRSRSADDLDK